MNELAVADKVLTIPGESKPQLASNQAVSFVAAFEAIRKIVGKYPAPTRPNRNRPVMGTGRITHHLSVSLEELDAHATEPVKEWLDDTAWTDADRK